jgi:formylglycine-generating enzyme required for sulfatase activity
MFLPKLALFFPVLLVLASSSAEGSIQCPNGYIPVLPPAASGVSPFCVARFEMKLGVGGAPESAASGLPWANLNRTQAISSCQGLGDGYDLINNSQWQQVARQIESNGSNWSSGQAGLGSLPAGHVNQGPNNALAADPLETNLCFGRSEDCSTEFWSPNRRVFNVGANTIWDFSGNVSEWVRDNFTNAAPILASAGSSALDGVRTQFGAGLTYAEENLGEANLGIVDLNYGSGGLARGSSFANIFSLAGIYFTDSSVSPDTQSELLGFRCIYQLPTQGPISSIQCPENYIAVEPSASSGLQPFCVAKFEMKAGADGKAQSSANGDPWVNIDRTEAETACTANGNGFDLIRNMEWQAIAREIEGNSRNWSGGAVGSGDLSQGNSASNPVTTLAASMDDRKPCFGTGVVCDDSSWNNFSRVQELKFGKIWDVAGNVTEWMKDIFQVSYQWQGFAFEAGLQNLGAARDRFGPAGNYAQQRNFGLGHLSLIQAPGGLVRGGSYLNPGAYNGVFAGGTSVSPDHRLSQLGFRCVFRPNGDPGEMPVGELFVCQDWKVVCGKDKNCRQKVQGICRERKKHDSQARQINRWMSNLEKREVQMIRLAASLEQNRRANSQTRMETTALRQAIAAAAIHRANGLRFAAMALEQKEKDRAQSSLRLARQSYDLAWQQHLVANEKLKAARASLRR